MPLLSALPILSALAALLGYAHLGDLAASQQAEGLSWLYRLCRTDADRAELAARGITPTTRAHHISELEHTP